MTLAYAIIITVSVAGLAYLTGRYVELCHALGVARQLDKGVSRAHT